MIIFAKIRKAFRSLWNYANYASLLIQKNIQMKILLKKYLKNMDF